MIKGVSSYIRFSISIYEQSIHNINYKMQCIPVVIVINSIILCHKMKANKYRDLHQMGTPPLITGTRSASTRPVTTQEMPQKKNL